MKITHFGHACVLVEVNGAKMLLDPGSMSTPEFDGDLHALLLTHSHVDHLHLPTIHELIEKHAPGAVITDADSGRVLTEAGVAGVTVVNSVDGVGIDVDGTDVEATTVPHAIIHCDLPGLPNNAYLLDGRVLHPGDAFWEPARPVDVLLLPIGGPWMKLSDSVDYLRAVAPRVAIPIHQGGLADAHRELHCNLLRKLGPADTQLLELRQGAPTKV